jgi:hypothetical protein
MKFPDELSGSEFRLIPAAIIRRMTHLAIGCLHPDIRRRSLPPDPQV